MLTFTDPETHARFLQDAARTWAALWGPDVDAVNTLLLGHPDHPVPAYNRAYRAALGRVIRAWARFYVAPPERPGLANTTRADALAGELFLVALDGPDALPVELLTRWRTRARTAAKDSLGKDEAPYVGPMPERSHHKRKASPRWEQHVSLPSLDTLPAADVETEDGPDPVERVESLLATFTPDQRKLAEAWLTLESAGKATWKAAGALVGMAESATHTAKHRLFRRARGGL